VARYLAEQGATVTVTDLRSEEVLAPSVAELEGLPIRFVLGRHDERDFLPAGADMIVRNPGVPRRAPLLLAARAAGVPIEMEMSLFVRSCPARLIGITGTKGKTSTSSICASILRAWDSSTVLAGNMGVTALGQLGSITEDTPVVVELSSWQLESLIEHELAPQIAVLTNISEDHLDHYDGFDDYAQTKRGIARFQTPDDVLIVNADDPESWRATSQTAARVVPFGLADPGNDGAWWSGSQFIYRRGGMQHAFDRPANPALRGEHGSANVLAAIAAAIERGAPPGAVARGLNEFAGVPHRMELVSEFQGVTFVNDTAATAPAAGIAALRAYADRRIHLIAGGADKRTDLAPFAAAAARTAASIALLDGSATSGLTRMITAAGSTPDGPFTTMSSAVEAAFARAHAGDVVLLSPGCASFGLFRDEFDRGEQFRAAVDAIARQH
jgi:UDP-N-acetylmuramoylalanine--D-glutamate ligase